MKLIIFLLTSCLLSGTSLFTMEKRPHDTDQPENGQKIARQDNQKTVRVKREDDDQPIGEIKTEHQDVLEAAVMSGTQQRAPVAASTSSSSAVPLSLATGSCDGYEHLLIAAVEAGDKNQVMALLQKPGINVNFQQQRHRKVTALIMATQKNSRGIIELLLNHPCIDVNACNELGETALFFAVHGKGYRDILEILLKKTGINVNARTSDEKPCSCMLQG